MENINAVLINDGVPQGERLVKLNQIAIQQMQVLEGNSNRNLLKWKAFMTDKLYAKYIWLISIIHDAGKISFEDIARKWDNAYIH